MREKSGWSIVRGLLLPGYRWMDRSGDQKAALFSHLRQRWHQLFQAGFDLLLDDVTSTCIEGEGKDILEAQPGCTAILRATFNHPRDGARPIEGLTGCYFIALEAETKPGESNTIEISLPIQRGLVFSGAYPDLPDQAPLGEPTRD